MSQPRGRDVFVKTRRNRAEKLAREFELVINHILQNISSSLRFRYRGVSGEPDYEVYDSQSGDIVCYFEAEFPEESRWPQGGDFRYPTIRWPSRKWEHYKSVNGLFNGRPVFLISVRGDLQDAYYIDCRTWFRRGKKECLSNGTVYYGLKKDDPDLGKGLKNILNYILSKIRGNYSMQS